MIDHEEQFKQLYPEIKLIVARRRPSWTLSTLPWEDVESILITRIYQQLPLYDTTKPLQNWANRLISNQISNLLRNNCYKHARPCITANPAGGECSFNIGGDRCGFTKSGKQCAECPLYAKWQRKKESAYNLNASLPLDTHTQQLQSPTGQFFDIEAFKPQIDEYIMQKVNKHDAQIYEMLFVKNMTVEEVAKRMKYKTPKSGRVNQVLRKLIARFKELAREGIRHHGL